MLFPWRLHYFTFHPMVHEGVGSSLSTALSVVVTSVCWFFSSHSDGCEGLFPDSMCWEWEMGFTESPDKF